MGQRVNGSATQNSRFPLTRRIKVCFKKLSNTVVNTRAKLRLKIEEMGRPRLILGRLRISEGLTRLELRENGGLSCDPVCEYDYDVLVWWREWLGRWWGVKVNNPTGILLRYPLEFICWIEEDKFDPGNIGALFLDMSNSDLQRFLALSTLFLKHPRAKPCARGLP